MSVNKVVVNGVEHDINDARFNPNSKTDAMTTPVGVSDDGKLYAEHNASESNQVGAEIARAQKAEVFTDGHLKEYPICYNSKMKQYNPSTDTEAAFVDSTDFIYADKDLYISLEVDSGVNFNGAYFIIQFYDLSYNLRKDIWIRAGAVNNFLYTQYLDDLKYKIPIPEPLYFKVNKGSCKNVRIFSWDEQHFGMPSTSSYKVPKTVEGVVSLENMPDNGKMCIIIPSSAKQIFCKSGFEIAELFVATTNNSTPLLKYYDNNAVPSNCFTINKTLSLNGLGRSHYLVVVKKTGDTAHFMEAGDSIVSFNNDKNVRLINTLDVGVVSSQPYPLTKGGQVINRAKQLNSVEWTCKANFEASESTAASRRTFKEGVKYRGIPYASNWIRAGYYGWHISPHTFLSAVNDLDSIFYNELASQSRKGPYYGLVCTSYAMLAGGFLYPQTNWGIMHDPHLQVTQSNGFPNAGDLLTNGIGHCMIAGGFYTANGNEAEIEIYESGSPVCSKNTFYSNIPESRAIAGGSAEYLHPFRYIVSDFYNPRLIVNQNYGIVPSSSFSPTNGTARPYKGDKSVYTSAEAVKINIKDATATTLYYSKCDSSLALTGETYQKTFSAGTTQTMITENLADGLWAVWTNKGTAKEYFEYHDISDITVTVTQDGNDLNIEVSDGEPWWYMHCETYSKMIDYNGWATIPYQSMSIPYNAGGDYSDYGARSTFKGGKYIFRRGTFGAYVIQG